MTLSCASAARWTRRPSAPCCVPFPTTPRMCSPHELVDFARGQGYETALLVNGNDDLLRTLVSNGLPVLLETWHEPEPNDGLGHYRLLVGYDDAAQQWTLYDSYDAAGLVSTDAYQGIRMGYQQLAAWWKVFNRTYVLVYPPDRAPRWRRFLADFRADAGRMWSDAEVRAAEACPWTATTHLPGSISVPAWLHRAHRRGSRGLRPGADGACPGACCGTSSAPSGVSGRRAHAGCAGAGRRGHPHHRQHRGDLLLAGAGAAGAG